MATLTTSLAAASNPVKNYKFFNKGGMWRIARYNFDITLAAGDGTTLVTAGTLPAPQMLLHLGKIVIGRVAGDTQNIACQILQASAINGVGASRAVTPIYTGSGTGTTGHVFGFPTYDAADYFTNAAANRFAGEFNLDLSSTGLSLVLTVGLGVATATTEQIKGYLELIGLDASDNTDTV